MGKCRATATGEHRTSKALLDCDIHGMKALQAATTLEQQIALARAMMPTSMRPDPSARTWKDVSARLGRNDLPDALWTAFDEGRLEDAELATGITHAWTMAEWPQRHLSIPAWIRMFDHACDQNTHYIYDGQIRARDDLPGEVTLYRGADEEHAYGMAWTDDRAQAEWFRDRLHREGMHLYVTTIEGAQVLARFPARGESEWVVDPADIEVKPIA